MEKERNGRAGARTLDDNKLPSSSQAIFNAPSIEFNWQQVMFACCSNESSSPAGYTKLVAKISSSMTLNIA